MGKSESGCRQHYFAQAAGPCDQRQQEQDVVEPCQQMLGAEPEELPEPRIRRLMGRERRMRGVEGAAALLQVEVVYDDRLGAPDIGLAVGEQAAADLVRVRPGTSGSPAP
jgi:hypothetical protein